MQICNRCLILADTGKEKSGSQPPVHPWQPTLPDVCKIAGLRDMRMTAENIAARRMGIAPMRAYFFFP